MGGACDDYDVYEGEGLLGQLINNVDTDSIDDCCDACTAVSDCHGWELSLAWDRCNLYASGNMKRHKNSRCISGVKDEFIERMASDVEGDVQEPPNVSHVV